MACTENWGKRENCLHLTAFTYGGEQNEEAGDTEKDQSRLEHFAIVG